MPPDPSPNPSPNPSRSRSPKPNPNPNPNPSPHPSQALPVPLYVAYSWHISLNTIFVVFRLLQYRSVATHLGTLIISLEAMVVHITSNP